MKPNAFVLKRNTIHFSIVIYYNDTTPFQSDVKKGHIDSVITNSDLKDKIPFTYIKLLAYSLF